MKTCTKCKQIVNIGTATCPSCEGHDFKVSPLKICSLCGAINAKTNLNCDQCGKNFSRPATEYAIATAVKLSGDNQDIGDFSEPVAAEPKRNKNTPLQNYIAIKAEIEANETDEKQAYFIPNNAKNEKPIILLPPLDNSDKKVEIFLVMPGQTNPADLAMQKAEISGEQDINSLNKGSSAPLKFSVPALFLFLLNLAIIISFGLSMVNDVMGFQIVTAIFLKNPAGQTILDLISKNATFGNFAAYAYPVLLGLTVISMILSVIFISTRRKKSKKAILILMQSLILLATIAVYLIIPVVLKRNWLNIEIGIILLIIYSFIAFITSILYDTEKGINTGKKPAKADKKPAKTAKTKKEKTGPIEFDTFAGEEAFGEIEQKETFISSTPSVKIKKQTEKQKLKEERKLKIKEKQEKDRESRLSSFDFDIDNDMDLL